MKIDNAANALGDLRVIINIHTSMRKTVVVETFVNLA